VKGSSSEYLLLAAVVEAAVRTVTLRNSVLTVIQAVHVFVGFVQFVVDPFSTCRG